ncbi:RNA methyltransferase [Abortiporus biennis]
MSQDASLPIFGNYHGYYSKRPVVRDPRLALLPHHVFKDARVLDIGCNEGYVTCEIAQSWGAKRVVGVDIDDTLIRAAWKHRRAVWSQQEPSDATEQTNNGTDNVSRKRARDEDERVVRVTNSKSGPVPDYFPVSCEHMFGPLPIPFRPVQGTSSDSDKFPHNVVFQTADWVSSGVTDDQAKYNVVVAFSITKWIHLNGGDEGLMKFFQRVHSVLEADGIFILEPQEWETYAKAKRMSVKLKETSQNLKLKPADFPRLLHDVGFGEVEHLGSTGEGGFRRAVDLYRKL